MKGGPKRRVGYKSSTLKNETLRSLETSRSFAISIRCHVHKFKINIIFAQQKESAANVDRHAEDIESRHHLKNVRYCLDELVYSNLRKFPPVSFLHPVEQAKVQRKDAISFAKVHDKRKANAIKEDGEWEV
jgi:hypothetical protein